MREQFVTTQQTTTKAWYRYPMMWVVIAPPVGAVIAGIITMVLILKHPDPVVSTTPHPAAVHRSGSNSLLPPTD